jgi:hypothetical protein
MYFSCLGRLVLKVVGFLKALRYAVKINMKYKFEGIYILGKHRIFKHFIRTAQ